jgi:hypothetical protein
MSYGMTITRRLGNSHCGQHCSSWSVLVVLIPWPNLLEQPWTDQGLYELDLMFCTANLSVMMLFLWFWIFLVTYGIGSRKYPLLATDMWFDLAKSWTLLLSTWEVPNSFGRLFRGFLRVHRPRYHLQLSLPYLNIISCVSKAELSQLEISFDLWESLVGFGLRVRVETCVSYRAGASVLLRSDVIL